MLRLPDVTDSSLKRTCYTGIHRPDDHERFEFQQKLCELELVINRRLSHRIRRGDYVIDRRMIYYVQNINDIKIYRSL